MRDPMLILHFIGLAMVLGTSLAYMFLGFAADKMEKEQADRFAISIFPLVKMGHWGLVVMLISGGALMTGLWGGLGSDMLLLVKLILYLALGAIAGMISGKMRKAKNGDLSQIPAIQNLGRLTLLLGLAMVVLAVLRFH